MTTDQSLMQEEHPKLGAIKSYADLKRSIVLLKEEKLLQEEMLRVKLAEMLSSISAASIVKHSIHQLATDSEVRLDMVKVGLNYGTDFIIGQIFGRRQSIPVYLVSQLAQKISGALIRSYSSDIFSGIRKLLMPRSKRIDEAEDLLLNEAGQNERKEN
jgi:hypothetical protein